MPAGLRAATALALGAFALSAVTACSAGEATPPFDPASRSTLLPAESRADLATRLAPAFAAAHGPEGRLVAVVDRRGDELLVASAAPMPDHGHVHFTMWLVSEVRGEPSAALPARADAAAFAGAGLLWVDHEGVLRHSASPGAPGRVLLDRAVPDVAVGADGRLALVAVEEPDVPLSTDLVAVDLETGVVRTLASGPGAQNRPILAPDGRRVIYVDGAAGLPQLRLFDLVTSEDRALSSPGPRKRAGEPEGFVPPPARREGLAFLDADTLTYDAGGERVTLDLRTGAARREVSR